jgi:ATP-dependent exoDNAse (exonuclease V) beta subunit
VITSSGGILDSPILCSYGHIDWAQQTPSNDPSQPNAADADIQLAKSDKPAKRSSVAPSKLHAPSSHNAEGMQFGIQVHSLLEKISWIDESAPSLPDHQAGQAVQRMLANPAIRALFERSRKPIRLLREQATDAIIDGKLVSGIIDRLHLHADADGNVTAIDIIDFKTDTIEAVDMIARYSIQLEAYRRNLQAIYPHASIRCWILAVAHAKAIELE